MIDFNDMMSKIIVAQNVDMEYEERADWYEIIIGVFEQQGWTGATAVSTTDNAYSEALYKIHPEAFDNIKPIGIILNTEQH